MKAIVVSEITGLDGLKLSEFPKPTVRRRGLIVEVNTAALNFPDVLQPRGLYQDQPELPFVLGLEFSGIVRETGEGCQRLKAGDRIVGMGQGALGQFASVREQMCFKLPDSIPFDTGAAIPLAGGTAMYGLKYCGQLKEGETLVVLGAAGGTGNYAVQIGKALGARVIAVCSSKEKMHSATVAGADEVVNYTEEDLNERLKELTDNNGVDVVYDPVGGDLFGICSRRMARGGRMLIVGFASGRIPELGVNMPLIKSYSVMGANWSTTAWHEPEISNKVMTDLFDLCVQGHVKPAIDRTFPLKQAKTALARLENQQAIGKTLIQVS
ncbi:NADPH:quinone oxidoreductase family protein [Sneathiella sp. HT1-7]|uniref:NADPH:quinone oxidoreductase family protein n=1 Tax=Sneathiella sp. HT1-7 TaxID=2887192 RepID=UPI001D1328A7|nr:NADPH:quinone oxidoreductase family protein [Sneathiella sp. HT1-7]MCC3303703.1 NADPH:quinone oxidoreductase family protein [Sneathiella sp. HT1-7]